MHRLSLVFDIRSAQIWILQAPGEAEAELAKMNTLGIIDGVLTDDGIINFAKAIGL